MSTREGGEPTPRSDAQPPVEFYDCQGQQYDRTLVNRDFARQLEKELQQAVNERCALLERVKGLEGAKLELGALHGRIGLFAAKHCSLSDNLPTDETFTRMGEYIDYCKGRVTRVEREINELIDERDSGRDPEIERLRAKLQVTDPARRDFLRERIKQYLCLGGLFNPEMMEHEKVRDLLMDLADWIDGDSPRANLKMEMGLASPPARPAPQPDKKD